MAAELLLAARMRPGARLATALFLGVKTDTQALGREAAPADEAAYRWLFPLVDHRALARIEHPRLPHYTFRMLNDALDGARLYGRSLVTAMGRLSGREGPATAVDLLVRLNDIEFALAHGYWDGKQVFSVRSLRHGREAWRLAKAAAGGEGPAGGHGMSAGGELPVGSRRAGTRAGHRLERRFLRAARAGKKRGRRLV
jgi:nanoRNase/pAp phosphatase (c-di-AMP/oligoRNAs hydrolase)